MSLEGVFPPIATELMALFGRETVFSIPSSTPINAARPDLGNQDSTTDVTAFAVWKKQISRQEQGELIQIGDIPVLVAAADLGSNVPDTSWRVTDSLAGKQYSVVLVSDVSPGPDRILYEMVIRG